VIQNKKHVFPRKKDNHVIPKPTQYQKIIDKPIKKLPSPRHICE